MGQIYRDPYGLGWIPRPPVVKRKVFVSYHHGGDQAYYDAFSKQFSDSYEMLYDNSLERMIDSDNTEYVIQRIRDSYITGSSCSLVLCGTATYKRKYVDWEIKATLDKQHGLIGVLLPTLAKDQLGRRLVPQRLYDNVASGYAPTIEWASMSAESLKATIEVAIAAPNWKINNSFAMMSRNQ